MSKVQHSPRTGARSSEPLTPAPPPPKFKFQWPPDHAIRTLRAGDVIRQGDGTYAYIEYTNGSGAYAVPLTGVNRDIKGHTVNVTSGGRMISVNSIVEIVNPLAMGGNSQEYRRYVRMVSSAREGKGVPMVDIDPNAPGVSFESW